MPGAVAAGVFTPTCERRHLTRHDRYATRTSDGVEPLAHLLTLDPPTAAQWS
jgi:peroxiredoxin